MKTQDLDTWIAERIKPEEISKYMDGENDFIPEAEIFAKLAANQNPDKTRIREILAKSLAIKTLTPDETAALIHVTDPELLHEMQQTALAVKKKVYDSRIITFAPLYLGNECVNDCLYCGFRRDNQTMKRKVLNTEEIKKEVEVLAGKIGHKRLIVVYGEHPDMDIDYMVDSIKAIYDVKIPVKKGIGNIRRVNVNAPALSVEELKRLYDVGIGTFQLFQETYHRPTYEKVHPKGSIKGDYRWRLYAHHRALEAGIDDVGLGALFGLYDWKYEVMGLIYHGWELEKKFGIGPHTVSFPRLEPAHNTPYTERSRYKVSDEDFKKIILVIRLALPYTGMIITARESAQIRRDAIELGITQTDASTQIGVGAYADGLGEQEGDRQQFYLGDTRSLEEVITEFTEMGFLTSFCTAGYRCGRTGKCIMDLLRSGTEGKFCKLNAVLTFREWLDDFAKENAAPDAEKVIEREIAEIKEKMPIIYPKFIKAYERVKAGERDIYF
jgi:2-iminoacetate synthase